MYREFRLLPPVAGANRRKVSHHNGAGSFIKGYNMDLETTNIGFETKPGQVVRVTDFKDDEVLHTADFKINKDCPAVVQFFLKRDTVTVPVEPGRVQTLLPTAVVPTPPSGEPPAPQAVPAALEEMTVPQKLAAGYRPVSKDGKVVWEIPS